MVRASSAVWRNHPRVVEFLERSRESIPWSEFPRDAGVKPGGLECGDKPGLR
ncbi:MAG TPA: hypothetical protein VN641_06425 [Urbifossiella sp.]|nr:hypothetical protein [Urbifossiella sp.]